MNLQMITPDEELYSGEVVSVKVPGAKGEFQVLNNHAPIVAALSDGQIEIEDFQNKKKRFTIRKGFIEVLHNNISLLVQGVKKNDSE